MRPVLPRYSLSLVLLGAVPAGCFQANADRARLTAKLDDVDLSLDQGDLGGTIQGTFTLSLDAGDLSEGTVTIDSSPDFSLVRADNQGLVRLIDATTSNADFPVSLEPATTRSIPYDLTDQNFLASGEVDAACDAGDLQLVASLHTTTGGTEQSFTVRSDPLPMLSGCE